MATLANGTLLTQTDVISTMIMTSLLLINAVLVVLHLMVDITTTVKMMTLPKISTEILALLGTTGTQKLADGTMTITSILASNAACAETKLNAMDTLGTPTQMLNLKVFSLKFKIFFGTQTTMDKVVSLNGYLAEAKKKTMTRLSLKLLLIASLTHLLATQKRSLLKPETTENAFTETPLATKMSSAIVLT